MRSLILQLAPSMALALLLSGNAVASSEPGKANPASIEPPASNARQATPGGATPTPPAESAAPVAAEPKGPVAEKLRDLIENKLNQSVTREHDRAGVRAFYQARAFAPLWLDGDVPSPRAKDAMTFLRNVGVDGLDSTDYPTPGFADTSPERLASDELRLTNSVLTFVRHASIGRVAFSRVSGAAYYDLKSPDPSEVLGKLAATDDIGRLLDGYNPQHKAYKALKAELAKARSGKAVASEAATATTASKSKKGRRTTEPVHARPAAVSIDTIMANMERWRWLPHDLGAAYVAVNIPDYTLKVVKNDAAAWSTRIVVGKPGGHATPLLTETMKFITVNPTWNVPPSIIRNEYLPALARDPGALARVGLQVGHNRDGSIRIFQPPGERNALGRIRFNFPNRFLVYQHDTPQKHLFEQSARAYSHGCMRVQNPDQYAEVLLSISQPEDGYTANRIRSLYGKGERGITFKTPIPVHITYQTAFVDDAGKLQVRPDIYGLDKTMIAMLHQDRTVADVPIARNYSSNAKPVTGGMAARSTRGMSRSAHNDEFPRTTYGWGSNSGWGWGASPQPFERFRSW
jgi:L,D-transpeptidase YcbB